MDSFFSLIAIATLIEALISYGRTIVDKGTIQWQIILAFILGIVFCYDTGLNFFAMLGLSEQWPIIGTLATAITLSRGSNYMFELYNQLTTWRKQQADQANNNNNGVSSI